MRYCRPGGLTSPCSMRARFTAATAHDGGADIHYGRTQEPILHNNYLLFVDSNLMRRRHLPTARLPRLPSLVPPPPNRMRDVKRPASIQYPAAAGLPSGHDVRYAKTPRIRVCCRSARSCLHVIVVSCCFLTNETANKRAMLLSSACRRKGPWQTVLSDLKKPLQLLFH